MTEKKLQVFISSTYRDLRDERQAAVQAVLDAGHIPAGMELFSVGDEEQLRVIRRWIDESDVFMLILGSRYGSIHPELRKSYTHLEFEHAQGSGKPYFCLILDNSYLDMKARTLGADAFDDRSMRDAFANEITRSNMSAFVSSIDAISLNVYRSLRAMERRNLTGWVRGDAAGNVQLVEEVSRLSAEKSQLEKQLTAVRASSNRSALMDYFAGVTAEVVDDDGESISLLWHLFCSAHELAAGTLPHLIGRHLVLHGLAAGDDYGLLELNESGRQFLAWLVLQPEDEIRAIIANQ